MQLLIFCILRVLSIDSGVQLEQIMNQLTKRTGVARIIAATRYSIEGLMLAIRTETAFSQETYLFLFLVPLALLFGETDVERVLLIAVLILVLVTELLNTAIEAVVDRIGTEFHPLSKQAKDLGSAAVFMTLSLALITWLLILW